jgi:hypothetical protein
MVGKPARSRRVGEEKIYFVTAARAEEISNVKIINRASHKQQSLENSQEARKAEFGWLRI